MPLLSLFILCAAQWSVSCRVFVTVSCHDRTIVSRWLLTKNVHLIIKYLNCWNTSCHAQLNILRTWTTTIKSTRRSVAHLTSHMYTNDISWICGIDLIWASIALFHEASTTCSLHNNTVHIHLNIVDPSDTLTHGESTANKSEYNNACFHYLIIKLRWVMIDMLISLLMFLWTKMFHQEEWWVLVYMIGTHIPYPVCNKCW